jgi:hypothetical protein
MRGICGRGRRVAFECGAHNGLSKCGGRAGGLAQLGERRVRNAEVEGSNPLPSTRDRKHPLNLVTSMAGSLKVF